MNGPSDIIWIEVKTSVRNVYVPFDEAPVAMQSYCVYPDIEYYRDALIEAAKYIGTEVTEIKNIQPVDRF